MDHIGMLPLNPDAMALLHSAVQRLEEVLVPLPESVRALKETPYLRDYLSLRFLLATQDCISLGAEIAAQYGLRPKGGMAGIFEELVAEDLLPEDLLGALKSVVTFRNQLLFDFDSVSDGDLFEALVEYPAVLSDFLAVLTAEEESEEGDP